MAHFAELDENNKVLRVVVIDNNETHDENGFEQEALGIAYCKSIFGQETNWIQTSYTSKIRKQYAGPGFIYDAINDEFIPPQPYPSWIFNTEFWGWYPPIEAPIDGKVYNWNESTLSWVEREANND